MTIRYKCVECDSVLKIKDQKAGKQGKCPKCSAMFTVPVPMELAAVSASRSPRKSPTVRNEEPIDMPLAVTPLIDLSLSDSSGGDFDPMAVLRGTPLPPTKSQPEDNTPKPTVAELMKEHQARKQRETAVRERRQNRKVNELLTDVETSGSAADALTRNYERKRAGTTDQAVSLQERRAAEMRAAAIRFGIQAVVGLTLVIGLWYGFQSVFIGPSEVPLVEVTGRITVKGKTEAGLRVEFIPVVEPGGPQPPAGGSFGITDNEGAYRLQFNAVRTGAIVWNHAVSIENSFAGQLLRPSEGTRRMVTAEGPNEFDFDL